MAPLHTRSHLCGSAASSLRRSVSVPAEPQRAAGRSVSVPAEPRRAVRALRLPGIPGAVAHALPDIARGVTSRMRGASSAQVLAASAVHSRSRRRSTHDFQSAPVSPQAPVSPRLPVSPQLTVSPRAVSASVSSERRPSTAAGVTERDPRLVRLVNGEARTMHRSRSAYRERAESRASVVAPFVPHVVPHMQPPVVDTCQVLHEVCDDVFAAVRKHRGARRAVALMSEAAAKVSELRCKRAQAARVRAKVRMVGVFACLLKTVRTVEAVCCASQDAHWQSILDSVATNSQSLCLGCR